jgi:hypothetical protein
MAKRSQAENKSVAATMTRLRAEMTPLALLARCGMQFIRLSDPKKKSEADEKSLFVPHGSYNSRPLCPGGSAGASGDMSREKRDELSMNGCC